jgi:hypothetical protein
MISRDVVRQDVLSGNGGQQRARIRELEGLVAELTQQLGLLRSAPGKLEAPGLALDEVEAQLRDAAARLLAGDESAQADFDAWSLALERHPAKVAAEARREAEWEETQRAANAEALALCRALLSAGEDPLERGSLSKAALAAALPPALAERLWAKRCLWAVRADPAALARTHVVDLKARVNVHKTDAVELRAVYAALPLQFDNDKGGEKREWREQLRDKLKRALEAEAEGTLPAEDLRAAAYFVPAVAVAAASAAAAAAAAAAASDATADAAHEAGGSAAPKLEHYSAAGERWPLLQGTLEAARVKHEAAAAQAAARLAALAAQPALAASARRLPAGALGDLLAAGLAKRRASAGAPAGASKSKSVDASTDAGAGANAGATSASSNSATLQRQGRGQRPQPHQAAREQSQSQVNVLAEQGQGQGLAALRRRFEECRSSTTTPLSRAEIAPRPAQSAAVHAFRARLEKTLSSRVGGAHPAADVGAAAAAAAEPDLGDASREAKLERHAARNELRLGSSERAQAELGMVRQIALLKSQLHELQAISAASPVPPPGNGSCALDGSVHLVSPGIGESACDVGEQRARSGSWFAATADKAGAVGAGGSQQAEQPDLLREVREMFQRAKGSIKQVASQALNGEDYEHIAGRNAAGAAELGVTAEDFVLLE